MRIEHPLEDGATDEEWRKLLRGAEITVRNDHKSWGPQDRRDFLNWLEETYPEHMPRFFESKDAALTWFTESKTKTPSSSMSSGFEAAEQVSHGAKSDDAATTVASMSAASEETPPDGAAS